MKRLFKILPIITIVVGIGGAWANQADDPCRDPELTSYVREDGAPEPTAPPSASDGMQEVGSYGQDFDCSPEGEECHWIYDPSKPEANMYGWILCPGEFVPNTR